MKNILFHNYVDHTTSINITGGRPADPVWDAIDQHFFDKELVEVNMVVLSNKDSRPFQIYCSNKPNYVVKITDS